MRFSELKQVHESKHMSNMKKRAGELEAVDKWKQQQNARQHTVI